MEFLNPETLVRILCFSNKDNGQSVVYHSCFEESPSLTANYSTFMPSNRHLSINAIELMHTF